MRARSLSGMSGQLQTHERLTATPLYEAVFKEILTGRAPGKPGKLVPRLPVGLLALVENFVMTVSNAAYMSMYGWWVLLQSCFSDHGGLSPTDTCFTDVNRAGLPRRTKTRGSDKSETARTQSVTSHRPSGSRWVGGRETGILQPLCRRFLLSLAVCVEDSARMCRRNLQFLIFLMLIVIGVGLRAFKVHFHPTRPNVSQAECEHHG